MKITVKLFAVLREQAGVSAIPLDLADQSTVDTALQHILNSHPVLMPFLSKSACAVNQAYSSRQTILKEGDELALIPPVSGG